jgi:hypothetical protein
MSLAAKFGVDGQSFVPSSAVHVQCKEVVSIFCVVQALHRRLATGETREGIVAKARDDLSGKGGTIPPALARVLSKAAVGKPWSVLSVVGSECPGVGDLAEPGGAEGASNADAVCALVA